MHSSISFFIVGDPPANQLPFSYDWGVVCLSLATAFLASLVALDLVSRIAAVKGTPTARRLLIYGAFTMGSGIWSMHFVGMMAVKMAMPVRYDPFTTLLSVLAAILSAYLAIRITTGRTFPLRRLLLGGLLMGIGIGTMHYVGMDAMRMPATIHYRLDLFILSLLVAVVTSGAALFLTFRIDHTLDGRRILHRYLGAALMGGGICGLHYTAMAATVFLPITGISPAPEGWGAGFFSLAIGLVILTIILGYHWELNRIETSLNQMLHLRESVESINRHDLKGPLGNMIGYLALLQDANGCSTEQKEFIDSLNRNAYVMLEMVNRSQDLIKMEMGTYHPRSKPVNLLEIIDRIDKESQPLYEATNLPPLRVRVNGDGTCDLESFIVRGEELLFYSMLSNLIRNAIEASPTGHPVTVSLYHGVDDIIRIHNRGTVPAAIRTRFFDKYVTAGKNNGTGLGTYSARLIAETLGGSIHLNTSEKTGTTVSVSLPR